MQKMAFGKEALRKYWGRPLRKVDHLLKFRDVFCIKVLLPSGYVIGWNLFHLLGLT
jgi:hypothetical protein